MVKLLEKDERAKNILDAATGLFAQKGYHDVTMEEIAVTVGVAKGTLYLYFPSKEELYWGILERGLHDLFAGLEQEMQQKVPPEEKLRAVILKLFQHTRQNSQFYRLFLREETKFSRTCQELLAPWRAKAFKIVKLILTEGVAKGVFRPMDTQMLAVILPGMVRSIFFFYEGNKKDEAVIREIMDFAFYGLKGAKGEM